MEYVHVRKNVWLQLYVNQTHIVNGFRRSCVCLINKTNCFTCTKKIVIINYDVTHSIWCRHESQLISYMNCANINVCIVNNIGIIGVIIHSSVY